MTIDMIFIVIVNYSNGDWRHLSGSWLFLMAVASINHSTRLSTFHCKIYLSKLLNILVPICLYQPLKPSIVSHIGILQFQTLYKLMPTLSVVNISRISRVSLTNTFFSSKYQAQIYRWILNWKKNFWRPPFSMEPDLIVSPSPAQPHHSADQVRSSPQGTGCHIEDTYKWCLQHLWKVAYMLPAQKGKSPFVWHFFCICWNYLTSVFHDDIFINNSFANLLQNLMLITCLVVQTCLWPLSWHIG